MVAPTRPVLPSPEMTANAAPFAPTPPASRPDPALVMAELERVLASPVFASAKRQQDFLRHIVTETLAGRADALKEYGIAIDVLGRDSAFDPRSNAAVRVEASRLRAKLDAFYGRDTVPAPVQISLPPGGYVPRFTPRSISGSTPEPKRRERVAHGPRPIAAPLILAGSVLAVVLILWLVDFTGQHTADWAGRPPTALAVLPMRNLSGDPGQDHVSDGLTDALITRLAEMGRIPVISMTSAMAYKDVDRPIGEIAGALGVSHVVQGSVLRNDDRVRVSAQLVDAESDRHLWARSYERPFTDALAVQAIIAEDIVATLADFLAPAGARGDPAPRPPAAALEANLKGRYFLGHMTEDGFRQGIAHFREAIRLAPDLASAHAGLATCFCLLGGHGFEMIAPHEAMPRARDAVMEALRLDDRLAEAHAFLGVIRLKYEWDWDGAGAAFRRAIALNPNAAQARLFHSFYLEAMGRQEEAISQAIQARTLDPLGRATLLNLAWQFLRAEQAEAARPVIDELASLHPGFWGTDWARGHYHRRTGALDRSIAHFEQAVASGGGHVLPLADLGFTYARAGRIDDARQVIGRLERIAATEGTYVSPYMIAMVHTGLGDHDQAFAWLEAAFADRARALAWLRVAEEFKPLRNDPRMRDLMARIGHPIPAGAAAMSKHRQESLVRQGSLAAGGGPR